MNDDFFAEEFRSENDGKCDISSFAEDNINTIGSKISQRLKKSEGK
jgi:hypothetical protein